MREPHFWTVTDPRTRAAAPALKLLMSPLATLYRLGGQRRIAKAKPFDSGLPVVCIGNLTLGGAGKTPVTEVVRAHFNAQGLRAASLSRGYRGLLEGAHRVDPERHTARDVGDEPLMLSMSGESWISKDRPEGARAMKDDGVQLIVMDDGHQNPTLKKTLSIVVIDATNPFGNGHIFPKGPMRERVTDGLARAAAVILMGDGPVPPELSGFSGEILRARLEPLAQLAPGRYIAFAGIGKPARFFDSLQAQPGVELSEAVPYPDHHVFLPSDISFLNKLAAERDAKLVTTDKDFVRLPLDMKEKVVRASVRARFEDEAQLASLLARVKP